MSTRKKPNRKTARAKTARARPSWEQAVIADYPRLRAFPGVLSVSIGLKEVKGALTKRIAVKVYVAEKRQELPAGQLLPKSTIVLIPGKGNTYVARRAPVDVVEVRGVKLIANAADLLDPALVGAQIGFPLGAGGAGTLGCWVRKTGLTEACFLTAGHVLGAGEGPVGAGQTVFQPQPPFPPTANEFDHLIVGDTTEGFIGNDITADGFLDYAAVQVRSGGRSPSNSAIDPSMPPLAAHLSIQAIRNAQVSIRKCGARTGCTDGRFSAFHQHFTDPSGKIFNNVLEFVTASAGQAIGDEGDSGSVVASTSPGSIGAVVGLLFAVSLDLTRGFVVPFERLAGLGFRVAKSV